MMSKQKRIYSQKGIGLIEVLVTVFITTIGLLGLSSLQMQSIRSVSDSGNRTHAIWVANDLINRIRANKIALANYITANELRCTNQPSSIRVCSAYFDGSGQQPPDASCTNADLALFDQWETLCGISSISGVDGLSNSSSFINTPGLVVTDLGNDDIQVTVSWNSRTGGTDSNGNTVYFLEEGSVAENQRESYSVVFRP